MPSSTTSQISHTSSCDATDNSRKSQDADSDSQPQDEFSECRTQSPEVPPPPRPITPIIKSEWLVKYHRFPIESRIYHVPRDLNAEEACQILTSDRIRPGILTLQCETYYEMDAEPQPDQHAHRALGVAGPFCDFLYAYRPDGFLCIFNLQNFNEVPRPLRDLLLDPSRAFLMFDAESQINCLVNTDSRLIGLSTIYDVKEIYHIARCSLIQPFKSLPDNITLVQIASVLFGVNTMHQSDATADEHLTPAMNVATVFDLYGLLETHYNQLNNFIGNNCVVTRLPPLKSTRFLTNSTTQTSSIPTASNNPPRNSTSQPAFLQDSPESPPRTSTTGSIPSLLTLNVSSLSVKPKPPTTPVFACVDIRTTKVEARFITLLQRVKTDFFDYFAQCPDNFWTPKYEDFYAFWLAKFHKEFALPSSDMERHERRLRKFIDVRVVGKLQTQDRPRTAAQNN